MFLQLRWFLLRLLRDLSFIKREGSTASFESRAKVDISWDDSPVEQTVHAIGDIVFSNRRRVSKGVVSEMLGQNAFRLVNCAALTSTDAQLLQLDVTDATLVATIPELIRRGETELFSEESVTTRIFWVTSQVTVLLLSDE